ncbi:MAG: hypothetical protein ACREXT_04575, partial [Gammaproteobacteria bacterium]
MLSRCVLCAALMAASPILQAAEVVFYDFDNVVIGGIPQTDIVNVAKRQDALVVDPSPWAAGIGGTLNQNGVGAPGGGAATNLRAVGAGPTVPAGAGIFLWDPAQSLGFSFTVADGFQLDLDSVSFAERFGGGGGGGGAVRTFTVWQLQVNDVAVLQADALLGAP